MIVRFACGIVLGLVALQGSFALAEREWGTLEGQFVLDGPAPDPRDLDTNGNKDVGKIPAEDLVVDAMAALPTSRSFCEISQASNGQCIRTTTI